MFVHPRRVGKPNCPGKVLRNPLPPELDRALMLVLILLILALTAFNFGLAVAFDPW